MRCPISEVVDVGLVVLLDLENLGVVEVRVSEFCVGSNAFQLLTLNAKMTLVD